MNSYWIYKISLLDIAGHDGVIEYLQRWHRKNKTYETVIKSVFYGTIFQIIAAFLELNGPAATWICYGLGTAYTMLRLYTGFMAWVANPGKTFIWLALLGAGLMWMGSLKKPDEQLTQTLLGAGGGVVASILLALGGAFLEFIDSIASVIVRLFTKFPAYNANKKFKKKFPMWADAIEINAYNVYLMSQNLGRDFVSHPSLRREGSAHKERIPKFTEREIGNQELVRFRMAQWAAGAPDKASLVDKYPAALAAAFGAAGVAGLASAGTDFSPDDWLQDMNLVNPATGLPMMGAIDVHGNPYGTDIVDAAMNQGVMFVDHSAGTDFGGGSTGFDHNT